MEQEQPLPSQHLMFRVISLSKNPLLYNKGTVSAFTLKKHKVRAKDPVNCPSVLEKRTSVNPMSPSTNTDPTLSDKFHKDEFCSWSINLDSMRVPSKSIVGCLTSPLERYLRVKEEIKLEKSPQTKTKENIDIHLDKIMKYKLESFTSPFKSLYAKNLKLHSSIIIIII
jgi:hypothetical protein